MNRRLVVIGCLSALVAMPKAGNSAPWNSANSSDQKQDKAKAEKAKPAFLTGCIDQKEGRYILVDERTLNPVANLEADGFETEGFAKHVGHKVTVRGTSNPGGEVPAFKVRSIETISDTCAPQQQQGKKVNFFGGDMTASSPTVVVAPQKPLEDPLAHLPCSTIVEYRKGQMIYNQDQPSTSIYLVIDGKVKVSRLADDGHQVVVDIYQPDEFFGESAFLNLPHRSEQATALENTKLMTWTTAEIEDIVMKRPRLAVALMQILVQRTIDFTHRIESFSVDNIARRLARSLIRFSERLGSVEEDGSVRMVPFTHELLSQYVGTSREIVTHYMNQFRRQGYLRYSRKGIILYREAFREWLRQNA